MKTIVGNFFAYGTDGDEIILDGIDIFNVKWQGIEGKFHVIGICPEGAAFPEYEGKQYVLDVYKTCDENEIYFGFVEIRMCYYLFFSFEEEDIKKLKKHKAVGMPI